jgi:hypothetical protein
MTLARRTRLTAVLAVVFLSVGAVGAPPVNAQDYAQSTGQAALGMIDYPYETLGWDIAFLPGRPGFLGLAIGPKRRIEIYVRPTHSVTDVAHTLAHELGHAVDLTYGTEYRHREYLRMRGFSQDADWFGCDECTDYATPAGDFAEVFEYWLLGGGDFRSQLAGAPDAQTLDRLSHLFIAPFEPSVRVFWRQRWRPGA